MYKKYIKISISFILGVVFCVAITALGVKTAGYFTNEINIIDNKISSGDWQLPESQAGPLDEYQTEKDFLVPYTAWDNSAGVSEVALWYRYEGGVWTYYDLKIIDPSQTNTSGNFDFTALNDGLFEFYTIAKDAQNNSENPPSIPDASTTVDTIDSVTTISVGEPKYEGSLHVTSASQITLTAFDATSEVDWTRYKIDTGVWQDYLGPFTLLGYADGPHVIYYQSKDNAGNIEAVQFLVVILDNQGPIISNVCAINITATSATIIWNTSEPATSSVEYGLDNSYGIITPEDPNLVTSHSVDLSGLTPCTTYHFRVVSKDALGNETISGDYTFKTLCEVEIPPLPECKVVINEVYYDVDASHGSEGTNEWIELYNPTSGPVNLKDYSIVDNSGIARTIHSNTYIPSNGYAVISKDASTWALYWTMPASSVKIELGSIIGNGLANTGDRVILKDANGDIVDQMGYGADTAVWNPACPDVPEGHSLARSPAGFDTDSSSDFTELTIPNPGTNPHSQKSNKEIIQDLKEKINEYVVDNFNEDNLLNSQSQSENEEDKDDQSFSPQEENDFQKDSSADNLPDQSKKSPEEDPNLPDGKKDNQTILESNNILKE